MESDVSFFTDTATLAFFDPARLAHRNDSGDWWTVNDLSKLEEVQSGVMGLINLGRDGTYLLRITDGDLTQDERDYAVKVVKGIGVEVVSGELFAGPGECVPGLSPFRQETEGKKGSIVQLPVGSYHLDVYAIFWACSKAFWSSDGNDILTDIAPADYVAVIRARTEPHQPIVKEPALRGPMEAFLFESKTRRPGPDSGMILRTSVGQYPDGTLGLESCGPGFYTPVAENVSEFSVGDRVHFRVLEVDHESMKMVGVVDATR